MKIGNGDLGVRLTKAPMMCRVCRETMVADDIYGSFWVNREQFNFHRHCLKMWLEYTFDVWPMTQQEIEADPTGELGRVETARSRREFETYKQQLIERLQSSA